MLSVRQQSFWLLVKCFADQLQGLSSWFALVLFYPLNCSKVDVRRIG